MELGLLKKAAEVFRAYEQFYHIKRVGDNLFKVTLDKNVYYLDLTRGASTLFVAPDFLAIKEYNAPFDLSLSKYCCRATIQDVRCDGDNRILYFILLQKQSYKAKEYRLQFEFTGRNTNAIILEGGRVIDALRHINSDRSFRVVKIGEVLQDLPQPLSIKPFKVYSSQDFEHQLKQNYQDRLKQHLAQAKITTSHHIDKKINKTQQLLDDIEDPESLIKQSLVIKNQAKLLINSLYQLTSFKHHTITLKDVDDQIHHITIPQESKSYSHAAQIFFAQSKRMHQKGMNTHIQQKKLQEKIDFYQRQKEIITQSETPEDIAIYAQKSSTKTKYRHKEEYESFFVEGVKISFGKNRQENIALLRDAKADDIWMHIRSIPASHMILRSPNKKISPLILQKAAEILVSFTKESGGNYEIDWTQRRFVKIIEGAHVNYSKYETITLKKEF